MGWNDIHVREAPGVFAGLETDARFYFLHSYYFVPASEASVLTTTDYHGVFASSVGNGNVYGVQFHPEKSHQWGIRLLKNFAEL
jgi:glutamine amidotransferase